MRKNLLKLSALLCLLALLCFGSAVGVQAATAAATAKTRYANFVKKYNLSSKVIIDIDGNGIPELLCFNKDNCTAYVFSYNKNTKKIVRLCYLYNPKGYGSYYNVSTHQVALVSSNTGGSIYKIYKISGTKAKLQATYKSVRNYTDYTYTYYKNSTKITAAAFQSLYKSIWKWPEFVGLLG